jgi:integrase
MAQVRSHNGRVVMMVRYLKLSRTNVYQYYRRVPADLRAHYGGLFIVKSLGTRDAPEAAKLVLQMAAADDALWQSMRSPRGQDSACAQGETREAAKGLLASWGHEPGARLNTKTFDNGDIVEYFEQRYGPEYRKALDDEGNSGGDHSSFHNGVEAEALRLLNEPKSKARVVFLSDALHQYLKDKSKGQEPKFARDTTRVIETVYQSCGDLPLEAYEREHAHAIRDALAVGHKSSTVERRLAILTAVFNHGIREFSLKGVEPPFKALPIKDRSQDATKRFPFTQTELTKIAAACREWDDDIRWIIAMQLDTGARLGEIVGLRVGDVNLSSSVPHIVFQPNHGLGRSLKNDNSERVVPLVGEALYAAQRAIETARSTGWLFPRYASDGSINGTSASGAVNKFLKEHLKIDKTSHSFRHSMKTRLRDAGVTREVQEALMGHAKTVADQYGTWSLSVLKEALDKVAMKH